MYTTPLMGYIDEYCIIFDGEDENKLEFTGIHQGFKTLVETLLTDFLAEVGIGPEEFVEVVAGSVHNQLNSFILTSILTVDDFNQFKAMMVKRNLDLTNEVLEMHRTRAGAAAAAESAAASSSDAPSTPDHAEQGNREEDEEQEDEEDDCDPELEEALRLSREQFLMDTAVQVDQEVEPGADASPCVPAASEDTLKAEDYLAGAVADPDADDDMDDDLRKALAMSMSADHTEMAALEREQAEIHQAIAMSVALEDETRRLLDEVKDIPDAPGAIAEGSPGASGSGAGSVAAAVVEEPDSTSTAPTPTSTPTPALAPPPAPATPPAVAVANTLIKAPLPAVRLSSQTSPSSSVATAAAGSLPPPSKPVISITAAAGGGTMGTGALRGAGYRSAPSAGSGATTGGGGADLRAIREAAVAAAHSQKMMLTAAQADVAKRHGAAKARAAAADASVGSLDTVRRAQYMEDQRRLLVAKKVQHSQL